MFPGSNSCSSAQFDISEKLAEFHVKELQTFFRTDRIIDGGKRFIIFTEDENTFMWP